MSLVKEVVSPFQISKRNREVLLLKKVKPDSNEFQTLLDEAKKRRREYQNK